MSETLNASARIWSARGNLPQLVTADSGPQLIFQRLTDAGGQVVARDLASGAETGLSSACIDCAALAAIVAPEGLLTVWSRLIDGAYQLLESTADTTAPARITRHPSSVAFPRLALQGDGTPVLVYQAADEAGRFQIWLRRKMEAQWTEPLLVSNTPGNNWSPALVACPDGRLAVAWDGYGAGAYDVYLRFIGPHLDMRPTLRLSGGESFHAHVGLAPAPDGVFVAWNRGTPAWGKDNEPYRNGRIFEYNYLHGRRFLELRYVKGDQLLPVYPDLQRDVLDLTLPGQHYERPRLLVSPDGALHVLFRYNVGEPRGGHRNKKRWQTLVMAWDGARWSAPVDLTEAHGLSTGGISSVFDADGNLLVAAAGQSDAAHPADLETHVSLYRLEPLKDGFSFSPPPISLSTHAVPVEQTPPPRHQVSHAGRTFRLYFGDVHRHTEFSFCRTSIDGSLEEVFRYARDAAAMDFAMSADHDAQEKAPDMWREVMQAADRFNVPGRFTTFFGYEWIGSNRNRRHRNVVSTRRVPPPPFEFEIEEGQEKNRDLKRLWETLPRGHAITIPHHTACNMSLKWGIDPGEAADADMEPLVEIFQASRGTSEYIGAPTLLNHFVSSGMYEKSFSVQDGAVSVGLGQGLRMGFMASSDHMSTHESYCCVYAEENTRDALMEAMIARRVYAASDRILCEFRLGGAFMGEALQATDQPLELNARFVGTGPIREVMLLRDSEPWRTWTPDGSEIVIREQLDAADCRGHYFYMRMQQTDTNLAWSSPVWVD